LGRGIAEGRHPNPFFDPFFYRDSHHDLSTLNGEQLFDHWIKHGIREGRRGCEHFWIMYYLNSHKDLVDAYGTDLEAAFAHWKTRGNAEARRTAPSRVLRLYYRRSGESHEIVARTGAEGSDGDLFRIFNSAGGRIGFGSGLIVGTYPDSPDSDAVLGTRIGYGLDRVTALVSNGVTGDFWHRIRHASIREVLDECRANLDSTSVPMRPRITFPNLNIKPVDDAKAAQQTSR
jgi:hypothetical protein